MSTELEHFMGQLISVRREARGWSAPTSETKGLEHNRKIECSQHLQSWSDHGVNFWRVAQAVAERRGNRLPPNSTVSRDQWSGYIGHLNKHVRVEALPLSLVCFLFPKYAAKPPLVNDGLWLQAWQGEFDVWLKELASRHNRALALSFSWVLSEHSPPLTIVLDGRALPKTQGVPPTNDGGISSGPSNLPRVDPIQPIAPPLARLGHGMQAGQPRVLPQTSSPGNGGSGATGPRPSSTPPPAGKPNLLATRSDAFAAPNTAGKVVLAQGVAISAAPSTSPSKGSSWVWRAPDPALPPPPAAEWVKNIDGFSRYDDGPSALLIGATVRGKGHKQDALYGDDSFGFTDVGSWRVLAVSDGAGSAKLSRFGSHIAVQAVVGELSKRLSSIVLSERVFETADLQQLRQHDSLAGVVAAYRDAFMMSARALVDWVGAENVRDEARGDCRRSVDAIVRQAAVDSVKYRKRVDAVRSGGLVEIVPSDCNATLLVATTSRIRVRGSDGSPREVLLVASCAIGDGMIVAFRKPGGKAPYSIDLMVPDAGQYSGESVFLSVSSASPDQIEGRFRVDVVGAVSDVAAIAAMSDGVADDYYGANVGMQRLLCDLIANGLLPAPLRSQASLLPSSSDAVVDEDVLCEATAGNPASPRRLPIAYSDRAVAEVKFAVSQALESPSVLAELSQLRLGRMGAAAASVNPSPELLGTRIRDWLDTYCARGSYDDRTLALIVERELRS